METSYVCLDDRQQPNAGPHYCSPTVLTGAAFLNPDGSLAVIVVNQTRREQQFAIERSSAQGAGCVHATLPGKTVATYLWPTQAPAG
jgi:O-glycosyl hydrolase